MNIGALFAGLAALAYGGRHVRNSTQPTAAPPPMINPIGGVVGALTGANQDVDVLARTLWGEARGEGYRGMQAVANVIMNRYKAAQISPAKARQFGKSVAEICKKPWQFSCWNANDPNRAQLLAVTDSNAQFRIALDVARLAVNFSLPDITGGADHYHTRAVTPSWSKGKQASAIVGNHLFFKLA